MAENSTTANKLSIVANSVHDYQKNGITVSGMFSATVESNTVTGFGATGQIAQNGVEIDSPVTGAVTGNVVSQNEYICTDPVNCVAATDIFDYTANSITVSQNTVSASAVAIYYYGDGAVISKIAVSNVPTFDGIFLQNLTNGGGGTVS